MSYMALYRKWRPDVFDEVKGQEHIVRALTNQIVHDRIAHAYLFCGTRGTGKTTMAKLFAKSVNCLHPKDGSPCGECAICKSITAGTSMDVIEIDAASNNGVDSIREIREEVQYSPAECKYKVYIIDEAHMITPAAWNALLKTLEEPPSYVIFIMATTEPHRIPITILSRCQKYDFHRITIQTISDRLSELMEREQQPVEKKALDYIAKAADGSMRDALSLLDQCIAFYLGETLTYEKCLNVLGAVDIDVFMRLLRAVEAKNVDGAIGLIDELIMDGREIGQFIIDFTWFLRNLMLLKSSEESKDRLDYSRENLDQMTGLSGEISMNNLMRYIRIFSELSNNIKYATQKRVLLELAVIKLCVPAMEQDYSSVIQRMDDLTDRLEALTGRMDTIETNPPVQIVGSDVGRNGSAAYGSGQTDEEARRQQVEQMKKELPPATLQELQNIVNRKEEVYAKLEAALSSLLKMSDVRINKDHQKIVIMLDEHNRGLLENNEEDRLAVENAFCEVTGKKIEVEYRIKQVNKGNETDLYPMEFFETKGVSFAYDDN